MAKKNGKDPSTEDDWDDIDEEEIDEEEDETGGPEDEEEEDEEESEELENEDEEEEADTVDVDIDPEDTDQVPIPTYINQTDYVDEDEAIEAGTEIEVKCANCALWERPIAAKKNKPLCFPGRQVHVKVGKKEFSWRMNADRFSCQRAFVPKELSPFVDYLVNDYDEVLMLKWTIPAAKQVIKMRKRIEKHCSGISHAQPDIVMERMEKALLMFQSTEQIDYVLPMIKHIADMLKVKRHKKEKKLKLCQGAEISWIDPSSRKRVNGCVLNKSPRKQIKLIIGGDSAGTLAPDKAKAWLDKNPGKSLSAFAVPFALSTADWQSHDPKIEREVVIAEDDG